MFDFEIQESISKLEAELAQLKFEAIKNMESILNNKFAEAEANDE